MEIVFFPERIVARLSRKEAAVGETIERSIRERHAFVQAMVEKRGMRAQLRSGNLLTGQLYVAFDAFPNAPKAKVDWSRDPTELPVVPSTVSDIEAKLTGIVAKLDKLPLEAIGDDLRKALVSLDQTLKDASKAVNRIDTERHPWIKDDPRRSAGHDWCRRPGAQKY